MPTSKPPAHIMLFFWLTVPLLHALHAQTTAQVRSAGYTRSTGLGVQTAATVCKNFVAELKVVLEQCQPAFLSTRTSEPACDVLGPLCFIKAHAFLEKHDGLLSRCLYDNRVAIEWEQMGDDLINISHRAWHSALTCTLIPTLHGIEACPKWRATGAGWAPTAAWTAGVELRDEEWQRETCPPQSAPRRSSWGGMGVTLPIMATLAVVVAILGGVYCRAYFWRRTRAGTRAVEKENSVHDPVQTFWQVENPGGELGIACHWKSPAKCRPTPPQPSLPRETNAALSSDLRNPERNPDRAAWTALRLGLRSEFGTRIWAPRSSDDTRESAILDHVAYLAAQPRERPNTASLADRVDSTSVASSSATHAETPVAAESATASATADMSTADMSTADMSTADMSTADMSTADNMNAIAHMTITAVEPFSAVDEAAPTTRTFTSAADAGASSEEACVACACRSVACAGCA